MKSTPSNCELDECEYNALPPPENSQECIGCPHLKDDNWMPKREKEED